MPPAGLDPTRRSVSEQQHELILGLYTSKVGSTPLTRAWECRRSICVSPVWWLVGGLSPQRLRQPVIKSQTRHIIASQRSEGLPVKHACIRQADCNVTLPGRAMGCWCCTGSLAAPTDIKQWPCPSQSAQWFWFLAPGCCQCSTEGTAWVQQREQSPVRLSVCLLCAGGVQTQAAAATIPAGRAQTQLTTALQYTTCTTSITASHSALCAQMGLVTAAWQVSRQLLPMLAKGPQRLLSSDLKSTVTPWTLR
jgi:hypothetical protein